MKRKRVTSLLLAGLMLFSLSACGSDKGSDKGTEADADVGTDSEVVEL